jgi:hypothetical protein
MPIRLLACDLDGTLADHDGHISDESVAALARARSQGVQVVVATGRLPFAIHSFLDRIGVTDEPMITGQGALIGYRDGRVLRRLHLDARVALQATRIAADLGAGMAYFTESEILVDRFVYPRERYEAWFGEHLVYDPAAADRLNGHLIKFIALHPDLNAVPHVATSLSAALAGVADVTQAWVYFVEGTTPGADKGAALAWLCARLGIDRSEVLAAGDAGNDITMLRWAGQSAAPADGHPSALAAAGWVAPPLPEHPVAATLAYYLGW